MNKVLFYGNSLCRGGAERVLTQLVNFFSENNIYDTYYLLHNDINGPSYSVENRVPIYYLNNESKNSKIKAVALLSRILRLYSIVSKVRPDCIVAFVTNPSIYALLIGRILKIPVIISIRSDPKNEEKLYESKARVIAKKKLFPHASGWVFLTEDQKQYYRNDVKGESSIILNPLSDEICKELSNQKREKSLIKDIVCVGNLRPEKRHDLLINAFSLIADSYPDDNLVIYGEGPCREELEKQIEDKHLTGRVLLPGSTNNIIKSIINAKAFVLPSDFEGLPNSLMEAMAAGIPCVATDCPCGGVKTLILHQVNGILCDVGNMRQIADAVQSILDNEELSDTLGGNAKSIVDSCDIHSIADQWKRFIDTVIERGFNN